MLRPILLYFMVTAFFATSPAGAFPWRLIGSDGERLFVSSVSGTDIKKVKVEFDVEYDISLICDLLWPINLDVIKLLFSNIKNINYLKIEKQRLIIYLRVSMEWPFQDREMVVEAKKVESGKGCLGLSFQSTFHPLIPKLQGVKQHLWHYQIVSKQSLTNRISIILHSHPGGTIGPAYASGLAMEWVLQTMNNIKNLVNKR